MAEQVTDANENSETERRIDESPVSAVASRLGGMILERNLRKGHTISIPSLGIVIAASVDQEEAERLRLEDVLDDAESYIRHYPNKQQIDEGELTTPVISCVRDAYVSGEISIDSYAQVLGQRVQQILDLSSREQ